MYVDGRASKELAVVVVVVAVGRGLGKSVARQQRFAVSLHLWRGRIPSRLLAHVLTALSDRHGCTTPVSEACHGSYFDG